MKPRFRDRVVLDSGRAWFDRTAREASDPFVLDGYGRAAQGGGEELLRGMIADVREKLAPLDGATLLEVGCGAGAMTQGLAAGTKGSAAVDFSHPMLLHAHQSGASGPDYLAADASLLPFRSGSFDRVVCYSVFNNFPSLEFAATVVRELVRVAKPGGCVLIGQVPNAERKDAWARDYAARFGGAQASRARSLLGPYKRGVQHGLRTVLALMGRQPPPALTFRYYHAEFFERVAADLKYRCEILPAYNLLRVNDSPALADYRLDIRITLAPPRPPS